MPHHSKQQRQMDGGVYQHPPDHSQRPNPGTSQLRSDSFPLPNDRQRMGIQPPSTAPPPPPSRTMHWPPTSGVGGGEAPTNLYHRVPESPDIQKLVRKPVTVNTTAEAIASNNGSTCSSHPSVASVLLLAAAAQQKADEQQQQQQLQQSESSPSPGDTRGPIYSHQQHYTNDRESDRRHSPAPSCPQPSSPTPPVAMMDGSRPLKKRKMDAAQQERTHKEPSSPAVASSPCNVSPMSQYSKSGVSSTAETSSPCDTETVCTAASGSSSYEDANNKDEEQGSVSGTSEAPQQQQQQDGEELLAPAQTPRAMTSMPNRKKPQPLPAALHWLLTESTSPALEHAAAVRTVLHWLPHGQAWKIIRWDAFRRQILPRFFSEFRLADGTVSVDAFLNEVTAWGFEEIRDGPDVGAFAHTLFRRGHPQLCLEMTYTPVDKPKVFSPETRSILRVPSLGSTEGGSTTTATNNKDSFYGSTPPVFVNYRVDDEWRGPQSSSSSASSARTCYSPIRIRSGRGARRQAPPVSPAPPPPPSNASSTTPSNSSTAASYPVSTRGRRKQTASPEPRSKKKLPLTGAVTAL